MIKRILLVGIIIATLFGVYILVKKPVVHYLRVKQIERDILNFLNKKDDKHISEKGKIIYNYITSIRNTECNISTTIEYYLNVVDEILQSKVYGRDIQNVKFPKNDDIEFYLNHIKLGWASSLHEDRQFITIQNSISEKDIKSYNNNTFKTELSKKLEKVLEHRSNDINKDWYMNPSKKSTIELPYNCYLEYHEGGQIDYDKIDDIYLNSEFIKCEFEKSDVDFDFNKRGLTAKIIYKDRQGNIGNTWAVIGFKNLGSYIELTPNLRVQWVNQGKSGKPSIGLGSHDVDRENDNKKWYLQQVSDVNRMIDEKINNEIIEKTEEIYNNYPGTDKAHRVIDAIECDFHEYVETGLSKEEANVKILENWYYDNERKVEATNDINNMLYAKGIKNKEIIERVRKYYDRDLSLEEIREKIDAIAQHYYKYIDEHGLDREMAYQDILKNWVYD